VSPACPLCAAMEARPLGTAHGRDYFDCERCGLAFLDPTQRPTLDAARARYDTHRNDPDDDGYRAFLSRLADELAARVPAGAQGLDYGSGPGPALSRMMTEAGRPTVDYDPLYANDAALLERTYDFIACSETAEHFIDPAAEFERLNRMLRPGGLLGVMTTMRDDARPFLHWWYVRDATHVCFYRPRTMEWIARSHAWTLELPRTNVALFRKHGA
jgi:SAM-dependent methyltransferase